MAHPIRLTLALGLLLLAGCATTVPSDVQPEVEPPTAITALEPVKQGSPLPGVELNAELLYQLLVAEFAAQQGALHLSAQAYLQTARSTGDPRLASRATRMAVYARDMTLALHAAQLWVELEPEQIDARQSLAALLLRHGQAEEARQHMERMIELAPQGKGQGFMLVANLLSQDGDRAQALALMKALTAGHGDEPLAEYAHAHLASQLGEQSHALEVLQTLLAKHPEMLDARILQARVYHAIGNEDAALASMQTALHQHRDNDQIRLIYARMLVDAQRLAEARSQFSTLLRSQPEDSDIVYALALLAMEAGDLDEAEIRFTDLLHLGERDEEARIVLGQIAQQRGHHDEAIQWFQSLGPNTDRYMDAQLQAARLMQQEQGLDGALGYLRGLSLHSQGDILQRYQGEADLLGKAGEYEQAMEVYDEALALFMDNPDLLYSRALLAEKMDRIEQAEQDLKRILADDPEHIHALNALGYTLVDRTERYQEGLKYIQRAYQQRPDDPAILDSMGWAYFRLGKLEQAEDYLRRAYALMPDGEIGAHLGEVLWQQGKQDEARQIWQDAQQRDPNHPILQDTLQRLDR